MATETALARRGRDVEAQSTERKNRAYKYVPQERAQREYVGGGVSLWTYVQTL
jgi:hypothetical protein